MAERQIVGLGGIRSEDDARRLYGYIVGLARRDAPSVCFVPTAVGDDAGAIVGFYERFSALGLRCSHVPFFPWPPPALRELVLDHDVVVVSGGNTANMLAIWRVHGFDSVLREAWEQGIVLCGGSAGMICWFEASVTDSFGPHLDGMRDGLGFLRGSACPHYDGEELRRPRYHDLVANGFPPGVAADDGVAVHFRGTALAEVVTTRAQGAAYRVELVEGAVRETRLDARLLA